MRSSLTTALKGYFEPQFRLRGERYVLERRATCLGVWTEEEGEVESPALWAAEFQVQGSASTPYRVAFVLDRIERNLEMGCTCPMGQDAIPCKHVWAALSEFEVRYPLLLERLLPEPVRWRVHCEDDLWVENTLPRLREEWNTLPGFTPSEDSLHASPLQAHIREWYRTPYTRQFGFQSLESISPFKSVDEEPSFAFVIRPNAESYNVEGALCDRRGHWRSLPLFEPEFEKRLFEELVLDADREILLFFASESSGDPWEVAYHILKPYVDRGVVRIASDKTSEPLSLRWDAELPYMIGMRSEERPSGDVHVFPVLYRNQGEEIILSDPDLILGKEGIGVYRDAVIAHDFSRFFGGGAKDGFVLTAEEFERYRELYQEHVLDLPRWMEDELGVPTPEVTIDSPEGTSAIVGNIWLKYGDTRVSLVEDRAYLKAAPEAPAIVRDGVREFEIWNQAQKLGVSTPPIRFRETHQFRIPKGRFDEITLEVLEWGWPLQAIGKSYRKASRMEVKQSSGIDWLGIRPQIEFEGGLNARIDDILKAIKNKDRAVRLGDGTYGVLPQVWLERVKKLSLITDPTAEGEFKLGLAQAMLLAEDEAWDEDAKSQEFKGRLQILMESLKTPGTMEPSNAFSGSLRPYQKTGLSWVQNLRNAKLGGVLADDMGLGKTIQILAHLQLLRESGVQKPSLIVVPKSLLFNWQNEAERFAPDLRVKLHATHARLDKEGIEESDVVIVTYQTLVRDSLLFLEIDFDTVVLDEGQMIKNRDTQSATICRALRSDYRLVLTGTPVENSVTDLFSIMDFLNPKMLHKKVSRRAGTRSDPKDLVPLARALRPFILRRRKSEVLTDLPPKVESVVYCDLSDEEKQMYEDLRLHYERRIEESKSKQVGRSVALLYLEALLRLRQIACHTALLKQNDDRSGIPSTKVGVLLDQLQEVKSEGRKALVFSQFTSFFDLIEPVLRENGFVFERIDGSVSAKVRNDRVQNFQSKDSTVDLMLLSLKAGGTGLNLTAADCVFVLDPWWNIAAENQAIDRAHRIGQTESVSVYRLIAKNTVEERIQKLQAMKRTISDVLVDGVGVEDLKTLSLEDFEYLLSGGRA